MSFEEFRSAARLYVIGALEPNEMEAFEKAREQFGKKPKIASSNVMPSTKRLP